MLGINNSGVGDLRLILKFGLIMILTSVIGGLCGSLNNVFVHITAQNTGNEIRKDCFRKIMTFSFPQMDRFGTGSLITRVTNDITQAQNLVAQFIRGMIRTSMLTFGSIFFLFRLNRSFGFIVLCAFPLILGCMIFCLYRANPLLTRLQAELDQINGILQEDISGIRIIKACVREAYEKIRFGKANDDLIRTQLRVLVIFAFMNPAMNALMYTAIILILFAGSSQAELGLTTPGTVMAAITYATQLLNGILMLILLFQSISKGVASWKRLRQVLHSEPDLKDGDFGNETDIRGKVEFRDVSFAFAGTDQTVLNHINLTIHPGETIAIMGATGCGKTALIHLILRFYDATSGSVRIDDIDVREYKQKALREKISAALQKSELFNISIGENIAWGCPDAKIEEIYTSAHIAQADDFIKTTPNGYNTMVAERGVSLSGGQKQRIAIARAILKPFEILIFDDSTSALDLKTEAVLHEALRKAHPESTKIIVAQRIASVRHADRIVILNNGIIEGCGTHTELMKSCKTYQDIFHSQIGKKDEES